MRLADQIAFVNHDIEDAVRAGVLDAATLPKDLSLIHIYQQEGMACFLSREKPKPKAVFTNN